MKNHSIILLYTFVNNKELDCLFLSHIKKEFKTIEKINESTYSLRNINCSKCVDIIKKIYDECIKQYPSKGKDYISILYSAKLVDIREKEKEDRIIENIIVNGKG